MRRLEWQMDRMLEGHVYNTVILNLAPSGPLYGSQPDSPPFFSRQWWDILRGVLNRARARGMRVWLYDQLGFSTAHIQDRLMDREASWRAPDLRALERDITGPTVVRIASPGKAVAACALRLDDRGRPTDPIAHLTSSLSAGYLNKQMPAGRWRIMLFYEAPGGFDYMNRVAAAKLLNYVHGEFERKLGDHLGSTVPGTFQDELPAMNRWTRRFLAEFLRRKGYDLRPWLPMLWYDLGGKTVKVRCDVADVQAALLEEAFFRPLYEWHERHKMICSYDQMTRDADPIEANRYYVDYMRTMRWFQAPGNDQTGLARPHSSLAHLYRRPRVWLEGFYNSGWGQTLEEIAGRIHEFYSQGSNLYNPHAWYYTTLGGWWEWAPPCTSFRQPYWRHYPLFADYVARMSYVLSQGSHVCDIAVLYPSSTIHAGGTHVGAYDEAARQARDAYKQLCAELEKRGVDYDILDEASLLHGSVRGGQLRVADERYKCVLLPSVTTLPRQGFQRLVDLVRTGGMVAAIGRLPSSSKEYGANDAVVQAAVRSLFGVIGESAEDTTICRITRTKGTSIAVDGIGRWLDAVIARMPKHADGADHFLHRRIGETDVYYLVSGSSGRQPITLRGRGNAMLLLPWTGRAVPLPTRPAGPSRVAVTMDFSESRAAFVVLGQAIRQRPVSGARTAATSGGGQVPPASPRPSRPTRSMSSLPSITLDRDWQTTLVPTMDNRWGDFALPPASGTLPVECRRFAYREEATGEDGMAAGWQSPETKDDDWRTVTATFGTYWWITKPGMGQGDLKLPGPEDGDWRPDHAIWQPAVFSMKLGIEKDPIYGQWLGPKGRIPDEYLDFGVAAPGTVRFAVTFLHVEKPCDVLIRCGSGDPRVAVNSKWLPAGQPLVAHLLAGYNALTMQLRHPATGHLRTYVHVGPLADSMEGPDWIWTRARADFSDCFARKVFTLDSVPQRAVLSITADNGYEVYLNGVRLGRDIGVGTEHWSVAERYPVARYLRQGPNVLAIHAMNLGGAAGVAAVLSWTTGTGAGGQWRRVATDGSWRVISVQPNGSRLGWTLPLYDDSRWETATVVGKYPCEPWGVVAGLRRVEPAILPESGWLNGEVLPWIPGLILDAKPGIAKPVGWYRFRTPPGTTSMRLSIVGRYRVFIEGRECIPDENDIVEVPLDLQGPSLLAAVRVEQAAGRYEGAAFLAPVRFTVGTGVIQPGNWAKQGLPHYSGGLTYAQTLQLPAAYADAPLLLDLGRVKGTAQVTINGRSAGVRIWRPYRFDVTGLLRPGANRLEVTVYNTLGPYFGAGYPTPYVYSGQEASGMYGPVRLLPGDAFPTARVDLTGLVNIALADRGATVTASSEHASGMYLADSVVAGHTTGERWARGGGWNDATEGEFPDWIEVHLAEPAIVQAVKILTLEPAERYGIRDFDVFCQRGSEWILCGEVRDNEEASVAVGVPAIRTSRIRVVIHASNDDAYSRIIAVQVFAAERSGQRP